MLALEKNRNTAGTGAEWRGDNTSVTRLSSHAAVDAFLLTLMRSATVLSLVFTAFSSWRLVRNARYGRGQVLQPTR